jgi:hypothetical protein
MSAIAKTITGISGVNAQITVPGTNIVYSQNNLNATGIFYFDASSSSPVSPSFYPLSGLTDAYYCCYGFYNSNHTVFVAGYSGFIYQITLDSSGVPVSSIQLANSNSKTRKTSIAFNNGSLLYVINNANSTELSFYSLSTNTYTDMTTSGSVFGGIQSIMFYGGSLYLAGYDGPASNIFKGVISGSSITYSSYITGFVYASLMAPIPSSDTVYLTDYVSGGSTSLLYEITSFLTSPSVSVVNITPSSVINGFFALSLSDDYTQAYISNFDATTSDQLVLAPLGSEPPPPPDIPCFTAECEILTPDGYVRVDKLSMGQSVLTPDNRELPIKRLFMSEITATEETAPFRIPAGFFDTEIPMRDVILSPHHAYAYKDHWTLPVWTTGIEQEEDLIGKRIRYYHIQLEDYAFDKLVCSGLVVDSWEGNKDIKY